MNDQISREIILDATALAIQEQDVDALTFSHIATFADIGEGEVRRLFPHLEDLVKAAADRMYQAFLDRIEHELGDDDSPGAWTRAFIQASYAQETREDFPRIGRVLLSSVAYKPELIEPLRARQADMMSAMHADGLDPMVVYTVRVAMEGLWMGEMFGMTLVPDDRRDAFVDYLTGLTHVGPKMSEG